MKATLAAVGDGENRGTTLCRRKDGTSFFAEFASRGLPFNGRHARVSVVNDVTARHEAEEARALLAAIVQSSHDAIVSKRLDGTITSWNGGAERLFGYSAAEAIGQSIVLIVPPEGRDEEKKLVALVASGKRVEQFETVRRRKDGTMISVSISLSPILDATGAVVGASKTAHDLTAQRKADDALRRTEEQLRQAQNWKRWAASRGVLRTTSTISSASSSATAS